MTRSRMAIALLCMTGLFVAVYLYLYKIGKIGTMRSLMVPFSWVEGHPGSAKHELVGEHLVSRQLFRN